MESPFTGGKATLKKEKRNLDFRKESFDILYHFYQCADTAETFVDEIVESLNLNQVYNKYRERYGIPFTEEIISIREQYGLSATKMSEVLGLGINSYRNYESGEIPSVATGRLIRLAQDPREFRKLLEMSRKTLDVHEFNKVNKKIDHALSGFGLVEKAWNIWLTGNDTPDIFNGYKMPSIEKVGCMVNYFAHFHKPFTTALNKLLFYSDFFHFKVNGHSISGLNYKALPKGPVPKNYGGIYNQIVNEGYAFVEEVDFETYVGDRFIPNLDKKTDCTNVFTPEELKTLESVTNRFKGLNTRQIVDLSHEESGWQDNVDNLDRISFEYAFELRHI